MNLFDPGTVIFATVSLNVFNAGSIQFSTNQFLLLPFPKADLVLAIWKPEQ